MPRTVNRDIIQKDLEKIGLKIGDVVLVHSSLSKIGWVDGGADTVIDALLASVGDEGTILVPTLTGSSELSPQNPPFFDVRNTPCWTGKIPETFRKRSNAIRSLHPTHSIAAIGRMAEELAEGHENTLTPCGKNSPYDKLASLPNGKILLLGVDLESCTSFHHAEEIAGVSYHMQDQPTEATMLDREGLERKMKLYLHKYGSWRQFEIMRETFLQAGIMRTGKIGEADSSLLLAKEIAARTLHALKENPDLLKLEAA